MGSMPKSRCERAVRDAARRLAAGEITAATARDLTARARMDQGDRIRRAALDAAMGGA